MKNSLFKTFDLSNKNLKNILDTLPVGMVISKPNGKFEYVNIALAEMLGYEKEEIYSPDITISHPEDAVINHQIRQQLLDNPQQTITIEKRYIHKKGHTLLGLLSITALTDSNNTIERLVGQIINISDHKKIEKSANLFRSMINASCEAMFIIDLKTGSILDSNTQASTMLGYTYQEILQLNISCIDKEIATDADWHRVVRKIKAHQSILFDGVHQHKEGRTFPVEMSINYIVLDKVEYVLVLSRDITERKKSEALIWKQANYDMLTQLPNRNMLYDRLDQAIKHAQRNSQRVAVLCLDLDKFKEVNDTLGHDVGDKLLVEAGERIRHCIRDIDTIARLGGDEFCIAIKNVVQPSSVNQIANKILATLSEPFILGVNKSFISTSIGISFFPDDADNVDNLLKHSDQAMYCAKERGRNCFQYFTDSMQEKALDRMQLSRDLHYALQDNQFYIEYQPIFSLEDYTICKAEILLRWKHPERGLVSPEEFIPIAEENGIIEPIGQWIFSQILKIAKHWRNHYNPYFQMSINASPLYFREGNEQIHNWQNRLIETGLPGNAIVIEITEGLLMDTSDRVTQQLLTLRDAGIQVALDDFGTGYSSLAYLKKLDIDYLKIDKSFIENLKPGSHEEALCEAIIVMAHKLRLQVVAEGIETPEQYQLLKSFGCDYGQGFLFSRPLAATEIEKLFIRAQLDRNG